MMRVTTLYASSAYATAQYYTQYLTHAPGEEPGRWLGAQAAEFGLSGEVTAEVLERLLSGRDPRSGVVLGFELKDRTLANGRVVRAVAGFDATLSAPKSLSVWWALTGDPGLAACHDAAVRAVADYFERFGSTTRVRSNGGRLHPDSQGLTMAAFRQTTSRLDDPQLHTHLVISAKVQTIDGRWLALDARVLKQHQRALGGLYQSVLRAELTHRYGVAFGEIVTGQAEIAGVPAELLGQFSKRAKQVDEALAVKVAGFRDREGRHPSRFERAALEREAAADTRRRKSGHGVPDLRSRWLAEAADVGITPEALTHSITRPAPAVTTRPDQVSVATVIEDLSCTRSVWHRMDVMRVATDRLRPRPGISGEQWAHTLDRAVERVMDGCVSLDPAASDAPCRATDGRSLWIEPVAAHVTSHQVVAQEEAILAWVLDAQLDRAGPSRTVSRDGLDVLQGDAAASVAGDDALVVVVGPAGTGKTTMLRAAVSDLHGHGRFVFGVAPTAKAAQVLARETAMVTDTVAKLLHEWARPDGPGPGWRLPTGATLVIDEAGMLATPDLHRVTQLAASHDWRLVLVGDPCQLQAVGRGGLFAEVCNSAPVIELERVHRFTHRWEAAASLQLRHGDPRALDAYEAHGWIVAGSVEDHFDTIAQRWLDHHHAGTGLAITTTINDHVDAINRLIQQRRVEHGQLDPTRIVVIADGDVLVGDVVATRRNDRHLHTSRGDIVRNRQRWTVTAISDTGELTVSRLDGHGTVDLPADYVRQHVRLGYAATEPGNQADTQTASVTLATPVTTGRGLYVAMTRGREENLVCVVTDQPDVGEARDVLEAILATDRADIPAVTQRQHLARQDHRPQPRCQVPTWFHDVRERASLDYNAASRALKESQTERERLTTIVDDATVGWTAANDACASFDIRLERLCRQLDQARDDHHAAQVALQRSGLRQRRHARSALDDARHNLTAAEHRLDRERDHAAGPNRTRSDAHQQLQTARDALHRHDLFTRWDYIPDRLNSAEQRLDALDTWHEWATGKPVAEHDLAAAINVLELAADLRHGVELGGLAREWATKHGHYLHRAEPVRAIEALSIEIDL